MNYKKRGMSSPDNVTELLIGILALLLIGGMIFMLYKMFLPDENANAKKTIDVIEGKINYLNEEQNGSFSIQGFKGAKKDSVLDNGWFLVGWSKNEQGRPDKCFFDSCICICKGGIEGGKANLAKYCQDNGFCRKMNVPSVSVYSDTYYFKSVGTNTGGNVGGSSAMVISDDKKICTGIGLRASLIEISVEKKKESIKLIFDADKSEASEHEACF